MSGFIADTAPAATAGSTPLDAYQKRLMFFLSVACFFEGYDFFALAEILPKLEKDFGLGAGGLTSLDSVVNFGAVVAYLLVRYADRFGRKPLLTVTIAGYTICTLLSGLAPNVWVFGACQFLARMFLIGEWAVAMIFAAEEFPSDRRGMVIGVIQACSSLGAIACVGIAPFLVHDHTQWRRVFFVGAIPLVIVAVARRGLRETRRFVERGPSAGDKGSFLRIWRSAWRGRMLLMALVWGLTYVCTTKAIFFWNKFAVTERGFSDAMVSTSLEIAAVSSLPLVFASGKLFDTFGRRLGSSIVFLCCSIAVAGSYLLHDRWALTAALALGVFGTSAVLPVLNAYTAELFPTDLRSDAFAWSNNLLGRMSAVLAPFLLAPFAKTHGWGPTIAATAIGPVLALVLILWKLPETTGRELEATSALPGDPKATQAP